MKNRYRLISRGSRGGAFYCVDGSTGKRTSLGACSRDEAEQVVLAKNQSLRHRLQGLDDKSRTLFQELLRVSQAPVVRSAFALSDPQKETITDALKPFIGEGTKIAFETKPELVAGIELIANGQKIAWSISDYLGDLSDALGALLESKSRPAPVAPKIVQHAA